MIAIIGSEETCHICTQRITTCKCAVHTRFWSLSSSDDHLYFFLTGGGIFVYNRFRPSRWIFLIVVLSLLPKCAKFITFIDNICTQRDQSNPDQQYQSLPSVTQSPSPPRPKYGAKRAEEKKVDIKWVLKDEPVFPLAWLLGCTIQ